ncbi:MAG: hypothetical protein KGJ02_04675 [Verrucomicrobiota bacterium]|nr:hypothetical protein [Verrucomicrobiota bacterium]
MNRTSAPFSREPKVVDCQTNEPRPKGRGMIWEEFRTPPKFGCELPGPKGPGFQRPDKTSELLHRIWHVRKGYIFPKARAFLNKSASQEEGKKLLQSIQKTIRMIDRCNERLREELDILHRPFINSVTSYEKNMVSSSLEACEDLCEGNEEFKRGLLVISKQIEEMIPQFTSSLRMGCKERKALPPRQFFKAIFGGSSQNCFARENR